MIILFFFSDTFKWSSIFLSIYKSSGGSVSLCPCIRFRIICLRTTFYHSISVSVSARWISCHIFTFFLLQYIYSRLPLRQYIVFYFTTQSIYSCFSIFILKYSNIKN
nr:MAG TPA: hypothetical protein [Bacteriophage sp.]